LLPNRLCSSTSAYRVGKASAGALLDDYLIVHGFDPIGEVIQELVEANKGRSDHHYHCMALGNADGEQKFYFNPINPTASSMYQKTTGRFGVETAEQHRMVPLRRLDSLLAEGVIPLANYIKIDVEGCEKDVLLGAHELLSAGVLGLQTETNFGVSPSYPKSHFGTLAEIALENHLVVFDLAFNRIPRPSFQQALISKSTAHYRAGRRRQAGDSRRPVRSRPH